MITNLQIRNFRGLKNVSLSNLRRVNLLVGGNDTGKTGVLEALVLLIADRNTISDLPTIFRNNQTSGRQATASSDDRENFWYLLFYDRDPSNNIEITANTDSGPKLRLSTCRAEN
jgi:AAA15 family ATPase/GTPase